MASKSVLSFVMVLVAITVTRTRAYSSAINFQSTSPPTQSDQENDPDIGAGLTELCDSAGASANYKEVLM